MARLITEIPEYDTGASPFYILARHVDALVLLKILAAAPLPCDLDIDSFLRANEQKELPVERATRLIPDSPTTEYLWATQGGTCHRGPRYSLIQPSPAESRG
jgi:hypothetical protein